jgi:hypothetical protein
MRRSDRGRAMTQGPWREKVPASRLRPPTFQASTSAGRSQGDRPPNVTPASPYTGHRGVHQRFVSTA